MIGRRHLKLIRENEYVAEVAVDLIECSDPWAPYLSVEDAQRLDEVRLALRSGDVAAASKYGPVYRLTPVSKN